MKMFVLGIPFCQGHFTAPTLEHIAKTQVLLLPNVNTFFGQRVFQIRQPFYTCTF